MSVILSDTECVNIVKYVSWLEENLEKESGCYSRTVKIEIAEEYKKYESIFDKIIKGQFH